MPPFTLRRLPAAFFILLVLLTRIAIGEDVTSLADPKEVLNSLTIEIPKVFDFKIPPRPSGHVLDMARFITPETQQRLDDALAQEARDQGVDIYLLIVPSLQKNTLDPYTQRVAEVWMKGLFGAVIVFDDGTGRVAIQQSDVVSKRFYEFELSTLLRDAMNSAKRPRLSREGLEHTTLRTKAALHELKLRADREDRSSFFTRMGLAGVGLLAILLATFEYFRRRPVAKATSERTASESA